MLRVSTWLVFSSYLVLYILSVPSVHLEVGFFYVFDVPANTMLSDKLFQLFITLLVKPHKNAF